jgi:hypothetical protein
MQSAAMTQISKRKNKIMKQKKTSKLASKNIKKKQ